MPDRCFKRCLLRRCKFARQSPARAEWSSRELFMPYVSTFASRSEGHSKSGDSFHVGPPFTRWKRVPNTLQSRNIFCKRHRASFFFFLKVYTTTSIASECVCGLAVQFSRLGGGPEASFSARGRCHVWSRTSLAKLSRPAFFFMVVP